MNIFTKFSTPLCHRLVSTQNFLVQVVSVVGYYKVSKSPKLIRLGTAYGGWWVPESFLKYSNQKRTVISIGIGHDVSFDKELLERGYQCIALDPLSECVEFARRELSSFTSLTLENAGISTFSGFEKFFPPKNPSHDSWSTANMQNTLDVEGENFRVISLPDLFLKYNDIISESILVLKMDIEGAEKNVIPGICELGFTIDYLAIEMDYLSLIPFIQFKKRISSILLTRSLLRKLQDSGYILIKKENFNFFWVKSTLGMG
jgi:FkbM family methyltransferase